MSIKLVKFYADWCMPCKMMNPIVSKVCADQQIELMEIDIESKDASVVTNEITSIPAFLIIKDGVVVDKKIGTIKPNDLVEWIVKWKT